MVIIKSIFVILILIELMCDKIFMKKLEQNDRIVRFLKMTGAGNDFILVDDREGEYQLEWPDFTKLVCDRRYGVGADGLLVIENSDKADFRMLYYNSDGSYGGMCGNGGRCASKFFMDSTGKPTACFEALDYIYKAEKNQVNIILELKKPVIIYINKLIHLNNVEISYHFIDTGSPHVVIFMDDLPDNLKNEIHRFGVSEIGRQIRNHIDFASAGTNVDFIETKELPVIKMRTYERGVEAETLACGTGAVACAVIASIWLNIVPPINVKTSSDEILSVNFTRVGDSISIPKLSGSAKSVFSGIIHYNPLIKEIIA